MEMLVNRLKGSPDVSALPFFVSPPLPSFDCAELDCRPLVLVRTTPSPSPSPFSSPTQPLLPRGPSSRSRSPSPPPFNPTSSPLLLPSSPSSKTKVSPPASHSLPKTSSPSSANLRPSGKFEASAGAARPSAATPARSCALLSVRAGTWRRQVLEMRQRGFGISRRSCPGTPWPVTKVGCSASHGIRWRGILLRVDMTVWSVSFRHHSRSSGLR
jgi:hypothetical protein